MSFESALRTRMKTALSGLVGTRVYWRKRPQNSAFPSVVLTPWFGSRDKHMQGVMGTQRRIVQVSVFAETDTDAFAIRDAAIAAVEDPATVGGVEFQGGTVEMRPGRVDDTGTAVIGQEIFDATIWFNAGD